MNILPENGSVSKEFIGISFVETCHKQDPIVALRILLPALEYCHQAWLRWLGVGITSFQGFSYPAVAPKAGVSFTAAFGAVSIAAFSSRLISPSEVQRTQAICRILLGI
jgi:hypothetical protein